MWINIFFKVLCIFLVHMRHIWKSVWCDVTIPIWWCIPAIAAVVPIISVPVPVILIFPTISVPPFTSSWARSSWTQPTFAPWSWTWVPVAWSSISPIIWVRTRTSWRCKTSISSTVRWGRHSANWRGPGVERHHARHGREHGRCHAWHRWHDGGHGQG